MKFTSRPRGWHFTLFPPRLLVTHAKSIVSMRWQDLLLEKCKGKRVQLQLTEDHIRGFYQLKNRSVDGGILSLSLAPTEVPSEPKIAFFVLALLGCTTEVTCGLLCFCWYCSPSHVALRLVFGSKVRKEAYKTLGNPLLHVYWSVPCIIFLWIVKASWRALHERPMGESWEGTGGLEVSSINPRDCYDGQ